MRSLILCTSQLVLFNLISLSLGMGYLVVCRNKTSRIAGKNCYSTTYMSKIKSLELKSGRSPKRFILLCLQFTSPVHHGYCSLKCIHGYIRRKKGILCSIVPILYISSTDNSCCTLYRNLGTLL